MKADPIDPADPADGTHADSWPFSAVRSKPWSLLPVRDPKTWRLHHPRPASLGATPRSIDTGTVTQHILQRELQGITDKFEQELRKESSEMDRRMSRIEAPRDDLKRKVAELAGNVKILSEEVQARAACAKAMEAKLEEVRHQVTEDLRMKGVELEQKHQKATTANRAALAAVQEQRERQNLCVKSFGGLMESHLQEWGRRDGDTNRNLTQLTARIAALEDARFTTLSASTRAEYALQQMQDLKAEIKIHQEQHSRDLLSELENKIGTLQQKVDQHYLQRDEHADIITVMTGFEKRLHTQEAAHQELKKRAVLPPLRPGLDDCVHQPSQNLETLTKHSSRKELCVEMDQLWKKNTAKLEELLRSQQDGQAMRIQSRGLLESECQERDVELSSWAGNPGYSIMAEHEVDTRHTARCLQQEVDAPRFEIVGVDQQMLHIRLAPSDRICAEFGSMVHCDKDVRGVMDVSTGGCLGGLKRMCLGSNSLALVKWQNTSKSETKIIGLTARFPAKVVPINLTQFGGEVFVKENAFLAANEPDAQLCMDGAARKGGGEAIFNRLCGSDLVFLSAAGVVLKRELKREDTIVVDSFCVVAWQSTCKVGSRFAPKGGKQCFETTLKGPGQVILQSMPFERTKAVHASVS